MTPAQSRRALRMSVNDFAAALGVSPVTVRRWEMDPAKASFRTPGAATLKAIELLAPAPTAQKAAQSCTPGNHRCTALALAFFALWHTGELDNAARAAVARCEAGE